MFQDQPCAKNALELVVQSFNSLFLCSHNTCVEGGADEPLYQPASGENTQHRIIFSHDYVASALHEISHWCIAGYERRQYLDYGYWYAPDGRTDEQQSEFEKVEVKPQALEWIMATACKLPFRLSADNLNSDSGPSESFRLAVFKQVKVYCEFGLPKRANQFTHALAELFSSENPLSAQHYSLRELR